MKRQTNFKKRYDAIIVGARVAGAGTALLLARAGMDVLVIDKIRYGSDTLSTHALMRAGVQQLHRWGVLNRIVEAGTPAIRRTTFHYGEEAVEIPIQERDGVDALYAPRRTVLDVVLVDAAQKAGAEVAYETRLDNLLRDVSGRVIGATVTDASGMTRHINADLVIGADGASSRVANMAGADVQRAAPHHGSYIYSYWRGLNLNGTHWYYGCDVAAGAIPTGDDLACVFVGTRPEYFDMRGSSLDELFGRILAETDSDLASAVRHGERVSALRPFAGRPGFIRQAWGSGWALVGDASCFKDPLTAHGMTDALRDAELLANAVIAGTDNALAHYQMERDSFAVEFLELSDEIASFDWDFERVQTLHSHLSKLMRRENERVRAFDEASAVSVAATAAA